MVLPVSGPIKASDINVELGKPAATPFRLGAADVRALAAKPSGPVKWSDFRGKSSEIFEAFSLYVAEVGQWSGGDKVATFSPPKRGYFTHPADAYGYTIAQHGGISPTTFRGITISNLVEQHGASGLVNQRVDQFLFVIQGSVPSAFIKKIQIFYGTTLHFQFDVAGAVYGNTPVNDYGPGQTSWTWPLPATWHLTTGATYNVRIHYE